MGDQSHGRRDRKRHGDTKRNGRGWRDPDRAARLCAGGAGLHDPSIAGQRCDRSGYLSCAYLDFGLLRDDL